MRAQLLDEIFHGMLFTKIVYLLCEPYAYPPVFNEHIESFCRLTREEESVQVALVLMNLVTEAWVEELFDALEHSGIAPKVFSVVMQDEQRHIKEAELYADLGLPDVELMEAKLKVIEESLFINVFMQYPHMQSLATIIGSRDLIKLLNALDAKHKSQLNKIGLSPGPSWEFYIQLHQDLWSTFDHYMKVSPIEPSAHRKVLMSQFGNPGDPTMVGEFSIDISRFDYLNTKYSHEVLSVLMLQVVSLGLLKNPTSRTFLSHGRFYQDLIPHPSLVVRLPRCGDHLGVILFANCHERPTRTILKKVRKTLKMMAYCYKFREKLEQQYPALASTADNILSNMSQGVYPYPVAGNSFVSVSNIGHYGYERAKSPLCFNEAQKYTLLQVERRLVWNPAVNDFEPQDRLPISVSADHRVYDGNIPVPLLLSEYFNLMLDKMSDDSVADKEDGFELKHLMHIIDELSKKNIELTYRLVLILQTAWPEFLDLRAWLAEHL